MKNLPAQGENKKLFFFLYVPDGEYTFLWGTGIQTISHFLVIGWNFINLRGVGN